MIPDDIEIEDQQGENKQESCKPSKDAREPESPQAPSSLSLQSNVLDSKIQYK